MPPPVPHALHALLHASDQPGREESWAALVAEHSRLLLKVASAKRGGYDATMDRYAYILDRLRPRWSSRCRG